MNILDFNYSMKIILGLSFLMLPVSGFSKDASYEVLSLLPEKQALKTAKRKSLENLQRLATEIKSPINVSKEESFPYYMPKSKESIEALMGNWVVTYTIKDTTYTEKFVINEFYTTENGQVKGSGLYYSDPAKEGEIVLCGDLPPDLSAFYNTEYDCLSITTIDGADLFRIFNFKFSGDTITQGYFALGNTIEEASSIIVSKEFPLTGSRVSTSANQPNAIYNEDTGKLNLSRVSYAGASYPVTLTNQGDFVFKLQEVGSGAQETIPPDVSDTTYDDASGELFIPSLEYENANYRVILQNQGDFVFTIKEAEVTN
ncbi:MAG: hypothetical protein V3U75_11070 [Methylococcaceae bacterium]